MAFCNATWMWLSINIAFQICIYQKNIDLSSLLFLCIPLYANVHAKHMALSMVTYTAIRDSRRQTEWNFFFILWLRIFASRNIPYTAKSEDIPTKDYNNQRLMSDDDSPFASLTQIMAHSNWCICTKRRTQVTYGVYRIVWGWIPKDIITKCYIL